MLEMFCNCTVYCLKHHVYHKALTVADDTHLKWDGLLIITANTPIIRDGATKINSQLV